MQQACNKFYHHTGFNGQFLFKVFETRGAESPLRYVGKEWFVAQLNFIEFV